MNTILPSIVVQFRVIIERSPRGGESCNPGEPPSRCSNSTPRDSPDKPYKHPHQKLPADLLSTPAAFHREAVSAMPIVCSSANLNVHRGVTPYFGQSCGEHGIVAIQEYYVPIGCTINLAWKGSDKNTGLDRPCTKH